MKTSEEHIEHVEKKRKSSEEKLKSLVIVFLVMLTCGAGYLAYRQNDKYLALQDAFGLEESNAKYIAEVFEQIEQNLSEIRSKEGFITQNLSPEEFAESATTEARIFDEIEAIERLNDRNNELIEQLNASLDEKNVQLTGLRKSSVAMQKRLKEYRTRTEILVAETNALRENLDEAETRNRSMNVALTYKENEVKDKDKQLAAQQERLSKKEEELSTAYYRVGNYKDLKNNHVVYKEGGIAGLASVMSVRPDAKKEQFRKIDIYEQTMIGINSKEAEVLSNHDINSYDFVHDQEGNVKWLKINNPELFWENSKYLVVVTKSALSQEVAVTD